MAAKYSEYYVQLINARTKAPIDDDSGLYNVLTVTDPSEATIYSDEQGTAGSNPGTMTDGIIQFWTASSTTTVDLTILTASGHSVFVEALTTSQHRVEIDVDALQQTFITFYTGNVACAAVTDTGFTLPTGSKVKDCYLHATDASTAGGIDVGNSTDTDGFLDAAVISATGWKHYEVPVFTNPTASAYYISATQYRGALLCTHYVGDVGTATGGGNHGQFHSKSHTVANATSGGSLTYVLTATNSGGSGKGYIYVVYDRCPTQGN